MDLALQCSPDHPWVKTHPEWFTTRADGTIAYAENPPEEVPGHLPAQLRQRPGRHLRRGAPRRAGVDRPRRDPVPRRQPAHQAGRVLAVAHRRRREGPPRGHLAGRGLHQAGDDAHPGQGRLPAELHLLRVAQQRVPSCASTSPSSRARPPPTCVRPSGPRRTTSSRPTCSTAARRPGSCGRCSPPPWSPTYGIYAGYELMEHVARPGAEEQIDNEKYQYKDRHWADYEPGGSKAGRSLSGYLTLINDDPPGAPGTALAARHPLPPRRRRERPRLLQAATASRRHARTSWSSSPTSTRTPPARPRCASTWARWASTPGDTFEAHDLVTDERWTGSATTTSGSGPRSNPCTSSHVRRPW